MLKFRKIDESDYLLLEEFIFRAIFVPKGAEMPDRSIIYEPSVHMYIQNFGQSKDDNGLFAQMDGKIIGAAWVRIISGFGHVDDVTPELAISILPEYRSRGIGKKLMKRLFEILAEKGYKKTSLAVQKENPAKDFYLRLGYEIIGEKPEEYVMMKKLV